jgi:Na+-driven multidrug efflux pump
MAIERNGFAILNGIARIFLFAVPLLLILPHFFGLKGVWMAQPGADISGIRTGNLLCRRRIQENEKNGGRQSERRFSAVDEMAISLEAIL